MGSIKGLEKVKANLQRELKKIQGQTIVGLLEAAAFIRRDMEETPPLIPLDTGNLRASWFTIPTKVNGLPVVLIGFEANYAVFVHEMVDRGAGINWSRPGSGPKFFEAALFRNKDKILEIIASNAKF